MTQKHYFEGTIVATTGLHIGSGHGDFTTDARVVRLGNGELYIPGSSLKGALRSSVERMAASLQGVGPAGRRLRTCLLDLDGSSGQGDLNCPTVNSAWQDAFSRARQIPMTEAQIADWLYHGYFRDMSLCDTCRVFGSPYVASKVLVRDLPLRGQAPTEVRHGVGIDRDTGTARAQIKFDYEVVPSGAVFDFHLVAEDLNDRELGLLCCGLRELSEGNVALGGHSSRGLGGGQLTLSRVTEIDLADAGAWLDRLLVVAPANARGTTVHTDAAARRFVDGAIRALFEELEVR